MADSVEKSILATIIYYDAFGVPLSLFEIFKYLICPKRLEKKFCREKDLNVGNILKTLQQSKFLRNYIDNYNGFYFLKGKQSLYDERIESQKLTEAKWQKAKRFLKYIQAVPFIRGIALSGSMALGSAHPKSDIDLLVIVKKGRIWTGRLILSGLLNLMGVRRQRYGVVAQDKICLNHYITDRTLRIPHKSLYNAQAYARLVFLYEKGSQFLADNFSKENKWIKDYILIYPFGYDNQRSIKKSRALIWVSNFGEYVLSGEVGDRIERFLSRIQSERIKKDPLTCKKGGNITFSDNELKFHPDSRERAILASYNAMVKSTVGSSTEEKDSGLL